ncbi:MAG: hypothetical protein V4537_15555 [Pseudomonadota bacterium]
MGRHARSGSSIVRLGGTTRSICRHCGTAMIKQDGGWRVATADDPTPEHAVRGVE